MSVSIYGITKSEKRKYWYAYEDDPTFIAFRQAVNDSCDSPVPDAALYRLWYKLARFKALWVGEYSDKAATEIIESLCAEWFRLKELRKPRIRSTMLAWLRLKKPAITMNQFDAWKTAIFDLHYELQMEEMETRRERSIQRRRTMKPKGRPKGAKNKQSVRTRILGLLAKDHRSTPAMMAADLNENPGTVACVLVRLKKSGEVIVLAPGLYTLGTVAAPVPIVKAQPPKKFVRLVNDANWIAQNTGKWKPEPVAPGASRTCHYCRAGKCEIHVV